jgi:FkbM family methyltransferase
VSLLLGIVRRLATAPLFRRLTAVTPLLRLSFALRASLVRERGRFVRNELRRKPAAAIYRLRESGVAVAIRHHTFDVLVLDEIFGQREYEPPPGVPLRNVERAVDLGANIGLFGAWLLSQFPGARIVAYEADPGNAAIHRITIEANKLIDHWRLVESFAGIAQGTTRFVTGLYAGSHEGDGIDVPVVDVLPELASADLVKIDIEGAEWPILADNRFSELGPPIVVLEYHAEGSPDTDPAAAAERLLADAGYRVHHSGRKPDFGAGIVWGVRH